MEKPTLHIKNRSRIDVLITKQNIAFAEILFLEAQKQQANDFARMYFETDPEAEEWHINLCRIINERLKKVQANFIDFNEELDKEMPETYYPPDYDDNSTEYVIDPNDLPY